MKIALVVSGFAESSIALLKALADAGHIVDLYYCTTNIKETSIPGFDFKTSKRLYGGVYEVHYSESPGVIWCNNYNNCHVYIVQCYHTGQHSRGLKKRIVEKLFLFSMFNLIRKLNGSLYDCIDIITQNPAFDVLSHYLDKKRIIRSYHEVLNNHLNATSLVDSLQIAISRGEHIRVFSDKSANDVISYAGKIFDKSKLHVVPFGLFYGYKEFGNIQKLDLFFENYVLYFGQIHPYKGLSYLYKAIKFLNSKGKIIKLVVAGKGNDECLQELKNDKNCCLINRFISNDELIFLVKNSKIVVCPYLSVSQSGIPQTAFVFNKPLVATNLGIFSQIIRTKDTGLLVEPKDINGLANAIDELCNNNVLYNHCVSVINKFDNENDQFSWKKIVKRYEEMIFNL